MRQILLFSALLLSGIAAAQPAKYSTQDKKLIKQYEEALKLYDGRKNAEALQILGKLTTKSPTFAEPFMMRGQMFAESGKYPEAIADLEHVSKTYPNHYFRNYFYLGELYFLTADYKNALRCYTVFKQFPENDQLIFIKADLGIRSSAMAMKGILNPVPFDPVNLGPEVNSEFDEYYPVLTADGATLLFTRLLVNERKDHKQEDFFVSQLTNNQWTKAQPVKEINTATNEGAPTLSADGQILIFTACEMADGDWGPLRTGLGSCDLFYSQKTGDKWSQAKNLGSNINSGQWDSQPSFSADGKTLYYVRGKRSARGIVDKDVWQSTLDDTGQWSKSQKIKGKVNTSFEEESVLIHPDGKTLYFSSNGHPGFGGLDIFVSHMESDGSWGEPVNLGYPINTSNDENSLLVGPGGDIAYFASDRPGGLGGLDLYSFVFPESARPTAVSYAKGTVRDAQSFKKLEARFELIDLESGKQVIQSFSDPVSGEFLVSLPRGKQYALNVTRPGYLFYSHHFSLTNEDSREPYQLDVRLSKLEAGQKVVLNNVFFDSGKTDLKAESEAELNKLADFMNANPAMRVEIGGHTDDVGKEADNQKLSEGRAKAVRAFLVKKGIPEARLGAVGYGMSKPMVTNKTPEGRAQNRRTEFVILEM